MTSSGTESRQTVARAEEEDPRLGSMRSRRMIRRIIALMAALAAAAPAAASANPLLSGYGGPGQGSQAILGATLLNGPSSGGGSGSSSGGGSIGPPGSSTGAGTTRTTDGHASGHSSSTNAAAGGTRADSAATKASGAAPRPYSGGVVSSTALRGSGSLGLSSTDVVYIILALGVLGFTSVLTKQLTQTTTPRRRRVPKGMRRNTRVAK
jgi:hypothetical protein